MRFCIQKKDFGKPEQTILPSKHQQEIIQTIAIIQVMAIILGRVFQLFQFSVNNLYLHPHATDLWQYLLRHDMIELDSTLLMLIKENRWSV